MRRLHFEKYEGLGNDFVVIEAPESALSRETCKQLCDRHRGIGADGVLFTGLRDGRPFMTVINADGSFAEMCGNGLRCVALHLARQGLVGREFEVDTGAGPHRVVVHSARQGSESIEVWMSVPTLETARIPVQSSAPLIDSALPSHPEIPMTTVSMGNPHAVIFSASAYSNRLELGPLIQSDSAFPNQVNVGFARMRSPTSMDLHVYERGSGWTQACGTGACAAGVAAVETGRGARGEPIDVRLPGGVVTITVGSPEEPVRMRGPAHHVFSGHIELAATTE